MLILEKKTDIHTLSNIGASEKLINQIFLLEGWLVSIIGAVLGLISGLIICWLQSKFELIKLQGSGTFIIDAYPVLVKPVDVLLTTAAVILIGFLTSWFPVKFVTRKIVMDKTFF